MSRRGSWTSWFWSSRHEPDVDAGVKELIRAAHVDDSTKIVGELYKQGILLLQRF